ncbi:hypothetical protein SEPCBS57363_001304 [Sporothrix epigloea]|uniref:Lpxtg-domain-containing protein n=1 Tax=Sporothrix epigloea TaxID=1892477 RepID=A0ABP0D9J0_9PEZI
MTCQDSDYASNSAGIVFETCIGCELRSAYSTGNISDLNYLLYNLRYTILYCLFGLENNSNAANSPCIINPACGLLEEAFNYDNMTVGVEAYGFCQDWIEVQVPKCTACLSSSSPFMENYVIIMDAACRQMPRIGSTLSIQGAPFTTTPIIITTPSTAPLYTYTPVHSAISLGGKVGIAVGSLLLILAVAGFFIIFFGRRRRRAFLKSVEARQSGDQDGNNPNGTSHEWPTSSMIQTSSKAYDKYSTPTSIQPLRGWDSYSPVSVSTAAESNGYFPRHLSPYKHQGNSPVSADMGTENGPPYHAWPDKASTAYALTVGSSSSAVGGAGAGAGRHDQIGLRPSNAATEAVHGNSPANSPASSKGRPWPMPYITREETERVAHEYELAQIGVAHGGSSNF